MDSKALSLDTFVIATVNAFEFFENPTPDAGVTAMQSVIDQLKIGDQNGRLLTASRLYEGPSEIVCVVMTSYRGPDAALFFHMGLFSKAPAPAQPNSCAPPPDAPQKRMIVLI